MHRGRRLVTWIVVAALLGTLGLVWRGQSFETVSWVAGVLALFVALAPEIRRFLRGGQDEDSVGDPVDRAVETLATVILTQWATEEKTRRLQDPWPLPVRLGNTAQTVADHWEVIRGRPGERQPIPLSGELDQVVELFDMVPSRRLIVLGAAGSGKSVLMLRLTLGLMGRRLLGERVPVLLRLSSWNPSEQRLHEWLTAELCQEYPELQRTLADGTTLARQLVSTGRLLPILDGLDEMPDDLRAKALLRLNVDLATGDPIVLASRAPEYLAAVHAGDVLTAGAVVDLLPLGLNQVHRYLRVTTPSHAASKWNALFGELRARRDDPLRGVLSVPLMVSLVRVAYGETGNDPAELLDRARFMTAPVLEEHLLDRLIPTLYRQDLAQSPGPPFGPDQACRWFAFLANRGARQGGDFAWWQLYRMLPTPVWLLVVGMSTGSVSGLVAAAVAVVLRHGASTAMATGSAVFVAVGVSTAGSVLLRRCVDPSSELWRVRVRVGGQLWNRAVSILNLAVNLGVACMPAGVVSLLVTGLVRGWATVGTVPVSWQLAAPGIVVGGLVFWLLEIRHTWRFTRSSRPILPPGVTVRMSGSPMMLVCRLAGSLPTGLAVGIFYGLVASDGWIGGLVLGSIASLLAMLMRSTHGPDQPARVRIRSRGRIAVLGERVAAGLKLGCAVGALAGAIVVFVRDDLSITPGAVDVVGGAIVGGLVGVSTGVLSGMGAGLADWSNVLTEPAGVTSPAELVRLDRRATLAYAVLTALTAGLMFGLWSAFGSAAERGIGAALSEGLLALAVVSSLVAPTTLNDSAWSHWVLARACLAIGGRLPYRLLSFLRDAHRRGVLRQAGSVYQFRHVRLLERLKS
jgi:hypothetical protein